MAVYYGIVRAKHVEFEGDVPLAEGTAVEIRPRGLAEDQQAQVELAVKARLQAAGVLAPAETPEGADDLDEDFESVTVAGRPLSEQIIAERR
jgi:hypothetical protein